MKINGIKSAEIKNDSTKLIVARSVAKYLQGVQCIGKVYIIIDIHKRAR